ncbi:hypothetical protein RvY_10884-2 [Ramazzottius varieornatus]|uniref:Uncharacterized protein n=1 Tax=Ramazzottius varieornatus TaxID=947166 RepID=A0A1D1VE75_RAMVA|nr:hypothetical protein RvY_10884-2 [Ramazzottius varieornatus]
MRYGHPAAVRLTNMTALVILARSLLATGASSLLLVSDLVQEPGSAPTSRPAGRRSTFMPLVDDEKRKALDAAADAVINRKQELRRAQGEYQLTLAELEQVLLEKGAVATVKKSRACRRTVKIDPRKAESLRQAVNDVISKGVRCHSF